MESITAMKFRKSPGYYFFRVEHDGESFLITHKGKPCARLVPCDDPATVISSNGKIRGAVPLTLGMRLGG